ncbi:MAG: AbrB/MazE/SpoVT family DNA-binding domain-containing protein [Lachnospiraceae bacterium]|nr:AbrB/MazE/SpoVT family DNA-binding domain-containing protein [Lachnospiraceae bacterium]
MTERTNPPGKYVWTATVGEKGQIVIPKQAREIFDIRPGDTLLLLGDRQLGIAIPPKETLTAFASMTSKAFVQEDEKDE